ncbi:MULTISPECIES: hypothetical protein [unclassified Kitasatospora]|uniref:hypothetical protein n=1 Tax=unclassified Kitasatospora TaxID=2633591 RepID=UPI00382685BF
MSTDRSSGADGPAGGFTGQGTAVTGAGAVGEALPAPTALGPAESGGAVALAGGDHPAVIGPR